MTKAKLMKKHLRAIKKKYPSILHRQAIKIAEIEVNYLLNKAKVLYK